MQLKFHFENKPETDASSWDLKLTLLVSQMVKLSGMVFKVSTKGCSQNKQDRSVRQDNQVECIQIKVT